MDIEQLQSFVALSQTLNYTKAAENLFITQPTLSRHIKNLEIELGCQLFERNTKQVSMNETGQCFLKYATNILLEYHRGLSHIKKESTKVTDTLDFGFLRGGTEKNILSILKPFTTEYPKINIRLHDGNHNDLFNSLKNGTHDFCITMKSTLAGDDGLKLLPIHKLNTVLVVNNEHHLSKRKSVTFEEFYDQPYLCVHKHITKAWYDYVISLYLSSGYFPHHAGTCDSVMALLMLVSLGKGMTVLTDGCKNVMPENLVAVPIENIPSMHMIIGYAKKNINPAIPIFVNWFQKHIEDIEIY